MLLSRNSIAFPDFDALLSLLESYGFKSTQSHIVDGASLHLFQHKENPNRKILVHPEPCGVISVDSELSWEYKKAATVIMQAIEKLIGKAFNRLPRDDQSAVLAHVIQRHLFFNYHVHRYVASAIAKVFLVRSSERRAVLERSKLNTLVEPDTSHHYHYMSPANRKSVSVHLSVMWFINVLSYATEDALLDTREGRDIRSRLIDQLNVAYSHGGDEERTLAKVVRDMKHDYFPPESPLYELCEKIHHQMVTRFFDPIEFNARLAEGKTDIWVTNDNKARFLDTTEHEADFTEARNNGDVINVKKCTLWKHFSCKMIPGMKHHDEESGIHYVKVKLISQKPKKPSKSSK